ncbi:MAG: radical SAM protein, partial [Clostridia bacterium]|nr:radical SAM protein [Clostridia bacterium]
MNIQGFQKMTLLDFPGRVACTVFTGGCNLRCPFCHNGGLVRTPMEHGNMTDAVLDYLSRRRGILDGVCLTGGEPLLQPDLED